MATRASLTYHDEEEHVHLLRRGRRGDGSEREQTEHHRAELRRVITRGATTERGAASRARPGGSGAAARARRAWGIVLFNIVDTAVLYIKVHFSNLPGYRLVVLTNFFY